METLLTKITFGSLLIGGLSMFFAALGWMFNERSKFAAVCFLIMVLSVITACVATFVHIVCY